MSSDETDLIVRLHAVAERFEMPAAAPSEDLRRGRRRVRRTRQLHTGAAAAAVALVIAVTATMGGGQRRAEPDRPEPVEPPEIVVSAVPVWYDASGLHRGDAVEQTPFVIGRALALVRSGTLYLNPLENEVWFHPWGGEPRVVGSALAAGPGGDPNGDIAVWFDGSELVVYDTAAGREVSRTEQRRGVSSLTGDHNPAGNSFLQVSAERVVWRGGRTVFSHDVRTGTTSEVKVARGRFLVDVHDQVEIVSDGSWVLSVPGRAEQTYPDLESLRGRMSPSGTYALAIDATGTRHASAIVDTRTGELWPVPKDAYSWLAWSYGDMALVDTEDELLACDAAARTCASLPAQHPLVMPTN